MVQPHFLGQMRDDWCDGPRDYGQDRARHLHRGQTCRGRCLVAVKPVLDQVTVFGRHDVRQVVRDPLTQLMIQVAVVQGLYLRAEEIDVRDIV